MNPRTWLITGISSGFGRELSEQLLARGDRVLGTVRDTAKVVDLITRYPETLSVEQLDVIDVPAVRRVVEGAFARFGRIDVLISNAGYGLFGAADVPTGYADSLAHGIDFDTPGASIFGVVFGYAHQQLAEQAAAEFATGGHTLH